MYIYIAMYMYCVVKFRSLKRGFDFTFVRTGKLVDVAPGSAGGGGEAAVDGAVGGGVQLEVVRDDASHKAVVSQPLESNDRARRAGRGG